MTSNHVLKLRGNTSCVFSFFSAVLKVSNFQTLENSSAVHHLTTMLCPRDPQLGALSPGAHSFTGKICWYLNSQLRAKCLEIRMNRKLWRGGSWRLKQKWQMPGVCQAEREGQRHPCRGNSMGKGMEPWAPTMHAGRSAWFGDEAREKAERGSWKEIWIWYFQQEGMRGTCLFFQIANSRLGFPYGSVVKNLPAMQKTWVWSLGQEDPLEKKMATHPSMLAWTEESCRLVRPRALTKDRTWLSN